LRGRASQDKRLIARVPHGHWKTTTLIAALGNQGMRCSTTVDGAINADVFESLVEKVQIQSLSAGDIVVMDNLSSHKSAGAATDRIGRSNGAVSATVFIGPQSD
jgi:transposase